MLPNKRLSFQKPGNQGIKDIIDQINNINCNNLKLRSTISNVLTIKKVLNKNSNYIDPGIEKLNTIEKIIQLQEDLKIVSSIKQQFEGNQKKLIEKLNKFCLNYYKNKINMRRIFDYSSDDDAEKKYEYNLLTREQTQQLLKDTYDDVFDFIFLIRKNNNIMLQIIDNSISGGYKDISDFLVNFCYEDTINSSFMQEELLLIIYLLIEKCIIKDFPKPEELKNISNNDIYGEYIKNNILYHIFLSLTRKADIRNYLCSILPDIIMKVENLRNSLTVDIIEINKILNDKSKDEKKNKLSSDNRAPTYIPGVYSGKSGYLKRLSASNFNFIENKKSLNLTNKLKIDNRLTMGNPEMKEILMDNEDNENDNSEVNIQTKLSFQQSSSLHNINLMTDDIVDKYIENLDEEKNENNSKFVIIEKEEKEQKLIEIEGDNNENNENDDINDPIFYNTETNLEYLKGILKEYEEHNMNELDNLSNYNNNTIIAMKEYLNNLINDINSEDTKNEKYSNSKLINNLNKNRIKKIVNYNLCLETIIKNHQDIIEIITELLKIIKDNIQELPFFIKYLLNIIDILLDYKYKNNLSLYNRYMIKANFLLGNIILPVLENINYNGIITNAIISKITKKNLVIIYNILQVMLTGKLFFKSEDVYMTIYNQFIIEIMPMVFEIVQKIEYNIKLPDTIKGLTETIKDIDNKNRNINYDYFTENSEERFYFQSICFSCTSMRHIFNSLLTIKTKSDENENEKKQEKDKNVGKENEKEKKNEINKKKENNKIIIENILNNKKFWDLIFSKKENENTEQFIYMSKIDVLPSFENKIKSILKDNFIGINPPVEEKFLDEEVSRFKICLSEILTYTNLLHKEYLPSYMHVKKECFIHNQKLIDLILKNRAKVKYDTIINDDIYDYNENENDVMNNKKEDPNFKTDILPYILLNVKNELGSNSSDSYFQKMLYCCSYIQLHIDLLPSIYIEDNYKFLFLDLIKDAESNIHILRNNILNQLNMKVKGSEKTNMIISNTFQQIRNLEKLKCIEYLYSKLEINSFFKVKYSLTENVIKEVHYEENTSKSYLMNLVDLIPDYRKSEDTVEDIIDLEEKSNMGESLKTFIKNLKVIIRKEKILKKYSKEEIENICIDLVNHSLIKLYDKLFPTKKSKEDIKFYKKCCRLDFIKPENIIKDKNIVNENMWKTSMKYINEMDDKFTPADKIKCFAKAFGILQNSIAFCSGKNELGVDDTIKPLIYVVLKAKPKNIFTNYKYCQLYLDPDLTKRQFGILLTQICMVINIIRDMKYTELIDVTEEQFGKDEE